MQFLELDISNAVFLPDGDVILSQKHFETQKRDLSRIAFPSFNVKWTYTLMSSSPCNHFLFLRISPDKKHIASSQNGTLELRDTETGSLRYSKKFDSLFFVGWSHDSKKLVVCGQSENSIINLSRDESGNQFSCQTISYENFDIFPVASDDNIDRLVAISRHCLYMIDVSSSQYVRKIDNMFLGKEDLLSVNMFGTEVWLYFQGQGLMWYDIDHGTDWNTPSSGCFPTHYRANRNFATKLSESMLGVGAHDHAIFIYNTVMKRCVMHIESDYPYVRSLSLSHDSSTLLIVSSDMHSTSSLVAHDLTGKRVARPRIASLIHSLQGKGIPWTTIELVSYFAFVYSRQSTWQSVFH